METPEILAGYWTVAGDCYALGPNEVSPIPLRERVEAAAWAGYRGMAFAHQDLVHNAKTIGYPAMRRLFSDHGIVHFEVEYLGNWFKKGTERQQSDRIRKELLEAASELKARDIKCCGEMWTEACDTSMMGDEFATLCDDAKDAGTDVALEFLPMTNIRTTETAVEIVSKAGRPNGGLCVDIWHVVRGNIPFSKIAALPKGYIKCVELNDAAAEAVGDLWNDTLFHRLYPGEGTFDCPGFIKAVRDAGFDGFFSVEVINERLRMLPVREQAKRSFDGTVAQFK